MIKVELDRAGVRDLLLKSGEIESACLECAKQIQSRCGTGYAVDTYVGQNRVNAMVYADSYEARKDNLENNTLLKALG